jgi:LAS superfamily LD-carboxypeptidase LdcB
MLKVHEWLVWITGGGLVLAVAGLGVSAYNLVTLSSRVTTLESTLASTTALLVGTIEETELALSANLAEQKAHLETQLGSVTEQLGDVSGTVGTLEKLSKTDPELLAKYSKVFFLNENYAPERVVNIKPEYLYYEQNPETIHVAVGPRLEELLDEAKADGIELYVFSAYRSFDEQKALKGAYSVTYGAGTANTFSADQGYSEHQLGTTVDFITTGLNGQLQGFQNTAAYQWLLKNAHKYGFILSYPANNGYYIFEPWHWRYVGVKLATDLYEDGQNFYDLDQRDIDKYLVNIFD